MAYITITPHDGPVRVVWRGHTIVSTDKGLDLVEGGGRPVLYVPREDAAMAFFTRTTRSSHCPHKGDAGYFSLRDETGSTADNVVWTYETPLDAVSPNQGSPGLLSEPGDDRAGAVMQRVIVNLTACSP